jgi:hypothetical protein
LTRSHFSDYDQVTTERCERALLTLLGDVGPWRERIYLAGGLAPRYLTGILPEGARAHVGTIDVDLIIGLALADEAPETYRTLQNNLEQASFRQQEPSFRWARQVEGAAWRRAAHPQAVERLARQQLGQLCSDGTQRHCAELLRAVGGPRWSGQRAPRRRCAGRR